MAIITDRTQHLITEFLHETLKDIAMEHLGGMSARTLLSKHQRGETVADRYLPGRRYMQLPDEVREALKNLTSDDLARMRYCDWMEYNTFYENNSFMSLSGLKLAYNCSKSI